MKNTTQVRDTLVQMIGQIAIDQGYENDFEPAKIYKKLDRKISDANNDGAFPKTFVVIEKGEPKQLIGLEYSNTLRFLIIHVVKKQKPTDDAQAMVESALNDFERFFQLNNSLSQSVDNAVLVEFTTDGGILDPEGVLIIRVVTERMTFGNP